MYQAALILEGGALRGQYTAGVLDVFMESGIFFKRVVGVSAGALCGVNYISQQIGRSAHINVDYRDDKEYISIENLFRHNGIVNMDFLFDDHGPAWEMFDTKTYEESPMDFTAVATLLATGKPVYFTRPRGAALIDALKATSALPFVAKPQKTEKGLCLDGGLADSIPYQYALDQGFDKVVVIRTQDRKYHKKMSSKMMKRGYRYQYGKYPQFVKTAILRPLVYNHQVDRLNKLEKAGKIFVIAPKRPVGVKRLEKDIQKLIALYQEGRADGLAVLEKMKDYLTQSE